MTVASRDTAEKPHLPLRGEAIYRLARIAEWLG